MISPAEIRTKSERLASNAISARIGGELAPFPVAVRCNLKPAMVHAAAVQEVVTLREHSKERLGYGYSVRWKERRSRLHGQNRFPAGIEFETFEDLLRLAGLWKDFQRLGKLVACLRVRAPQLLPWAQAKWKRLLEIEGDLPDMLDVVEHLAQNPRPDCFPRELPLPISTKLIERRSAILAQWLDRTLPPEMIDYGVPQSKFAERYGFRDFQDHFMLRILDESLLSRFNCPDQELSLSVQTLSALPVDGLTVIFVENKVSLVTHP